MIIVTFLRLRGDEFRFLRIELDLSQKALGEYLGKTDQSVANWEKTGNIPREVDFLMRHIFRQTMNEASLYVEEVDRLRSMDQSDYDEWLSFQKSHGRWEQTVYKPRSRSCNTVSLLPFHLGGNLMESDLSFVPKKVPDLTDRQSQ